MQQKLQLQINEPCHENWDTMTAHQKGRFCGACQKTVIDFTAMSDEKLLAYFKNYDGNTCGHFENEQLNRQLITNTQTRASWQKWTSAVLLTGLLLVNKAKAQGKVILTEQVIFKKIADAQAAKVQEIGGQILDENGRAIPYASVLVKNENWGTATDSLGNFKLTINAALKSVELAISSVGYVNKVIKIDFKRSEKQTIVLNTQDLQNNVVVTGYGTTSKGKIDLMGSVTKISREIKLKTDSIKERDTLPIYINSFKIYPNPVKAGTDVNIQFNEPNNYLVRLVNLNGQILTIQNISLQGKQEVSIFNIPSASSAGEYFVQAISADKRFQSTIKLIVTH